MSSKLFNKHFGLVYTVGAAVFSWIFYFFLKGQMLTSAKTVIFFPDETEPDMLTAVLIILAALFEMFATGIKFRRIRHINSHPEEYDDFL